MSECDSMVVSACLYTSVGVCVHVVVWSGLSLCLVMFLIGCGRVWVFGCLVICGCVYSCLRCVWLCLWSTVICVCVSVI